MKRLNKKAMKDLIAKRDILEEGPVRDMIFAYIDLRRPIPENTTPERKEELIANGLFNLGLATMHVMDEAMDELEKEVAEESRKEFEE